MVVVQRSTPKSVRQLYNVKRIFETYNKTLSVNVIRSKKGSKFDSMGTTDILIEL